MQTIEILARDRSTRHSTVRAIVVHVNVGPDVEGGALSIAHLTQRQQGAYHEVIDDRMVIVTAHDNEVVAGATGGNTFGYHVCIIGDPRQTPAQWADRYSTDAVNLAAQRVALACQRFGIPIRKITAAELLRGESGICGHVDITAYATAIHMPNSGHWDPGPNFPWTSFIERVVAASHGAVYTASDAPADADVDEEDNMVISPQRAVPHGRAATATLDSASKSVVLWNGAHVRGDVDARKMFGVRIWKVPCGPTEKPRWIKERPDGKGFIVQCTNGATFDAYWN